eukprot:763101-Hanusia_phi.AAC.3
MTAPGMSGYFEEYLGVKVYHIRVRVVKLGGGVVERRVGVGKGWKAVALVDMARTIMILFGPPGAGDAGEERRGEERRGEERRGEGKAFVQIFSYWLSWTNIKIDESLFVDWKMKGLGGSERRGKYEITRITPPLFLPPATRPPAVQRLS